jgi:pyridoxamine 5'-phosphate oxidase
MNDNNDLKHMRQNYLRNQLLESNIDKNPFVQFKLWFEEVAESDIIEPNAMTIATATKDGIPSVRVVLLKEFDETGFTFFTNYKSRKGKELEENPNAAILFWWGLFERQIRIEGKIERISREDSEAYFNVRPLKSRLGALSSNQSEIIENRQVLENKFSELEKKYGDNPPMPKNWGGYKLIPSKFEFWQGRRDRLHDRIIYERIKNDWKIYRLSP